MASITDILRTMDYGPSPESAHHVDAWLEAHASGFGCFIGGAFTRPAHLFDVVNPATAERSPASTQGTAADVDAAVAAARKALPKLGGDSRATRARAISMPSRATSRSASASSPCWRPSTTASRSARRATSTCRSSRATSIITPAGRS